MFWIDGKRWAVGLTLVLGFAGCGTGGYERRMVESLGELGARSELVQYLYEIGTPLGDSGLKVRIPTFFTEAGVAGDGAQPPFFKLPDFLYAHEVSVSDGAGGQVAASMYLATPAAAGLTEEDLQKALLAEITPQFPSAAWQNKKVATLGGGELQVYYLTLTGPQDFGGRSVEGRFDLYLVPGQSRHALIGWRAPVAEEINFFRAAEASIGSISG